MIVIPFGAAMKTYRSVELFSGAGGLALGLEKTGWHHLALIERNEHACATIHHYDEPEMIA